MKTLIMKIAGMLKRAGSNRAHAAGYTMVEVMVSGILMTFSISAVVAVVGTGSQLGVSDDNRRQARAIVRSTFEQSYDFRNFATIPAALDQIDTVQINPREGSVLTGTRITRIATDSVNTTNGVNVPVRKITITLKWMDPDSTSDSVYLAKLIASVQ